MRFVNIMTPYRVGWMTKPLPWWSPRRYHRPWQSESGTERFARRALTALGAQRKMERDAAYFLRTGRHSWWQRQRTARANWWTLRRQEGAA